MSADVRFPITEAQLLGNFCETLLYGMYLVTCCFVVPRLLMTGSGREERWVRLDEVRWLMLSVAVILFVVLTFDVAIGLLHNFHAFIRAKDASKEFLNLSDWINVARIINNMINMIIGDFVLIYRCWVVHGRRWLVVVPSLILYFAAIAMAIRFVQVGAAADPQKPLALSSPEIRPWFNAFFAITAFQNVLTTSILIWRIWRVERQSEKYIHRTEPTTSRPRHLRKVIKVIAESGAVYTAMVFATFVVGVTGSNAMYPTSDMTLQATGILFNVILVRSSARRDQQFTTFDANERTHGGGTTSRLGTLLFAAKSQAATNTVDITVRQDIETGAREIDTSEMSSQSDTRSTIKS